MCEQVEVIEERVGATVEKRKTRKLRRRLRKERRIVETREDKGWREEESLDLRVDV